MEEQTPKYHAEFLKSPQHAALGLLTLGAGFMSGMLLPLIAGATLYTLGWIYLPDMPFFRRWVDRRYDSSKRAAEMQKVADFVQRRESLVNCLSPNRRERYRRLSQVCRDIETASSDSPLASTDSNTDPRLRKLDELMWTFLRLLGIEESLERFLDTERREDIPTMLKDAEAEGARLTKEVDALKDKGDTGAFETKQRYLNSRMERLDVLHKRQQRIEQAEANLQLVVAEQERLEQQIKLIRADAVASKNAETLTARIDATVEHLDQTNKWLSEMDEFKDLVGDMPNTDMRVGYEAALPGAAAPPIIQEVPRKQPARQRQM
jgi:cell division protein FtsB